MLTRTSTLIPMVMGVFCLMAQEDSTHPIAIANCLEHPNVGNSVRVNRNRNPYYLRGDFDGDGMPDYAVAVKGTASQRNGVLICPARRKPIILGADNPLVPPFSDMPDDNFVAPDWEVASRAEVLAFRATNKPVPVPRGESIMMTWEDGIHYIYWDGTRFRWSPLMQ